MKKSFLHIFGLVACITAFAQSNKGFDFYRPGSVVKNGNSVLISNTLITESTVDRAKELIEEDGSAATRLQLVDIPGGMYIAERRLAWIAQELDVEVTGHCFSACALVALAGRTLKLVPSKSERKTILIVHGTFNAATGEWFPMGLRAVDSLHERLPAINRDILTRAISFKNPRNSGLYIFGEAVSLNGSAASHAFLCEEYPEKCEDLKIQSLKQIGIESKYGN